MKRQEKCRGFLLRKVQGSSSRIWCLHSKPYNFGTLGKL